MSSNAYVELHCHSAYSFLDGASMPDELAATAAALGHEALALTDHDGVHGAMEHELACRDAGIRAIHGSEVTVLVGAPPQRGREPDPSDLRHVTLLVAEARGWQSLCRLLTSAHAHTRDRRDGTRTQAWVTVGDLCHRHEGLVCLTGCAEHGVEEESTLRVLRDAFGPDDLLVELQRPFLRGDRERTGRRQALARRLGLACVATGNVHAHDRERALLQDALVAVRHGTTLEASEPLRRGNRTHVLSTPQAMAARLADVPEAVAASVRLADRLRFDLSRDLGYRYPGAEDPDAARKLAAVCADPLRERYPAGHRDHHRAERRLEEELGLIARLGLSGFFLLHREVLELARDVAVEVRGPSAARALMPPGRGRGSSVSSIVCYLTGLSHVDPLENDLFLGRFLNDDLSSLPDIDLDFPRDVREKLIPLVNRYYGTERAALVAAFPTYRARGAIRELGAALGLPGGELERVARGSEAWSAKTVDRDVETALGAERLADLAPGAPSRWGWLVRLAHLAHGLPRHCSQHPGGMVISTRPLIDCCPVLPSAMEGRQMVMWDKDSCSDAGFLKIDLLGLGMLSCVERTVDLVAGRRGEHVDLSRIPYDDPETYGAIQRAETTGVFQIESRAQMGSLLRTRPENLEDLTIQVAIVRPGPIQGGAVNPFIERRQKLREDPSYEPPCLHPSLKDVLADTLQTIIFQDQVIEVAMAFAGFSAGQAEGLRRAMSRKRSAAALEAFHERFVAGAAETHGADRPTAETIWEMIQGFSGFGFPKAHGAAFGLLAYQSTWLRVHYGPEFLCALLDEQPMGFYPPDALIHEAQRRGIAVLPPDVQRSGVGCSVTPEGAVRLGLGYVKGIRTPEVEALVAERDRHGAWRSLPDLAARAGVGTPSLERLAWAGACDGLAERDVASEVERAQGAGAGETPVPADRDGRRARGVAGARPRLQAVARTPPLRAARRAALWEVGAGAPGRRTRDGVQLALGLEDAPTPRHALGALGAWDAMLADYASTGLTTGIHPLALLRERLDAHRAVPNGRLRDLPHGAPVRLGGFVVARQRPGSAKGVCFLLLEDEEGTVNVVVPPPVYERDRLAVRAEPLVVVDGRLERHPAAGGGINVLVHRVVALDEVVVPRRAVARIAGTPAPADPEREHAAEALRVAVGGGASPPGGPSAAGGDHAAEAAGGFRAVAPAVMSFAQGRRR